LRRSLKFAIVVIACLLAGITIQQIIFRSKIAGTAYVEIISEDGLLKLTMRLEKTEFTLNPREPVKILLNLTNIGDRDITLTFRYKSRFDFMVFDYAQAKYAYRWSYENVQGPIPAWSANITEYPGELHPEPPDVNTVTLGPGQGIGQLFFWEQKYDGCAYAGVDSGGWLLTQSAPKGRYRIEGIAGLGYWPGLQDNPLRYFQYSLPNGTLISTVLWTPGIDVTLG